MMRSVADLCTDLAALSARFDQAVSVSAGLDMPVLRVSKDVLVEVCHALKNEHGFDQLIDLCGVDMSEYPDHEGARFDVVYHLLSVSKNKRVRLKVAVGERALLESVVEVWSVANWFEREAFDMYGIIFNHHPDLRRLLTDYGFVGHPLRKDFPLTGRVEMFFDETQWRCVYRPNQLEERVLVPKKWPEDNRA